MDSLVVFDCAQVIPNRFALTLAAAARSRALHRGAEPRSNRPAASASDLALHEIAEGAFTPAELGLFLEGESAPRLLLAHRIGTKASRRRSPKERRRIRLPREETVH